MSVEPALVQPWSDIGRGGASSSHVLPGLFQPWTRAPVLIVAEDNATERSIGVNHVQYCTVGIDGTKRSLVGHAFNAFEEILKQLEDDLNLIF